MVITSLENSKVKDYVKLQQRKYRDFTNTYIIEGEHLVIEAYKAGLVKELILLDGEKVPFDIDYIYVSNEVMKKISTLDTAPTIMAVCNKSNSSDIVGDKVLLLDGIQDPGNLGTIIRSSVAFNIDTIILSENTVDLYNPKVLRATQGMYCHVNIISRDAIDAINYLKDNNYIVYGTNVNNGYDVREVDSNDKFCLIMGNEGNGVREGIQNMCDKNLYIKMNNAVESLNVGVACSILLYELGR
ncbi:MAG: RNA methyltransferase [Bacilli bacterium]|nr:RNA methyltransferase [Bacilli bacterium]